MKILAALTFVIVLSCDSKKPREYGSLSGNVYWKYNNFVGNKPDAGSDIKLYSLTDSTLTYAATADVRGDYSFDSIPTGSYLLSIQSENTNSSATDLISSMRVYAGLMDYLFHSNVRTLVERNIPSLDSLATKGGHFLLDFKNPNGSRLYRKYLDSAKHISEKVIDSLSESVKTEFMIIGTGTQKLDFNLINIKKGRKETVVTDFGTTYY